MDRRSLERSMELQFFNEDGSMISVQVGERMKPSEVCNILASKNSIRDDPRYCLIEVWEEKNLARIVQDYENVLQVNENLNLISKGQGKLFFGKYYWKYYFYEYPEILFPHGVVGGQWWTNEVLLAWENIPGSPCKKFLSTKDEIRKMSLFSKAWIQTPSNKNWTKVYLLLFAGIIYYSHDVFAILGFLRYKMGPSPSEEDTKFRSQINEYAFKGKSRMRSKILPFILATSSYITAYVSHIKKGNQSTTDAIFGILSKRLKFSDDSCLGSSAPSHSYLPLDPNADTSKTLCRNCIDAANDGDVGQCLREIQAQKKSETKVKKGKQELEEAVAFMGMYHTTKSYVEQMFAGLEGSNFGEDLTINPEEKMNFYLLGFASEATRNCWMTVLNLDNNSPELRETYRDFKIRHDKIWGDDF